MGASGPEFFQLPIDLSNYESWALATCHHRYIVEATLSPNYDVGKLYQRQPGIPPDMRLVKNYDQLLSTYEISN
jgi:hypothetical protein